MTVQQFLQNLQQIVDSNPTYRTGGTGKDGTCDCVGAIMGALGGEFDLHSSNYFARYQMQSLDSLMDESQLHPGSIVYKSRRDTTKLNDRYLPGGTHHAGTSLDYYHVGVVTRIDPLEITHCTSSGNVNGFTTDRTINGWSWFGDLLKVDYTEEDEPVPVTPVTVDLAVVYSENGDPVRMRSKPTTEGEYNTIVKVPFGAEVEVTESDGTWSTVRWNEYRGYMMNKHLRLIGATTVEPEPVPEQAGDVTITISRNAAAELLKALGGVL